jgi:hypothetical protein
VTSRRCVSAEGTAVAGVGFDSIVTVGVSVDPQFPQKRAWGSFSAPQVGQPLASALPHDRQNLRPARFSVPQFAQITRAA